MEQKLTNFLNEGFFKSENSIISENYNTIGLTNISKIYNKHGDNDGLSINMNFYVKNTNTFINFLLFFDCSVFISDNFKTKITGKWCIKNKSKLIIKYKGYDGFYKKNVKGIIILEKNKKPFNYIMKISISERNKEKLSFVYRHKKIFLKI